MRSLIILLLAVAAALGLGYWWQQGRPVELPDAPTDRLQCVSYAPYRKPNHTPFDKQLVISPSQIELELELLSKRVDCVRIYSVDQGLSEVPRIARKLGMKVMLGLWIGRDAEKNELEIQRGLQVIKRDADAIVAVIVGNEVLLRREQPEENLRRYIERVRAATTLPVTYADVWEFWLKHPDVAESTSFVTVHILPYWEDHPANIDVALEHVMQVYDKVSKTFPVHRVMIGETGWPSAGRNRAGAQPSLVNQARYIREFTQAAQGRAIDYNIIEAFDQPWKRRLEGTVGGYWGLYSAEGVAKFPFFGPVIEDPDWLYGVYAAGIGALVLIVLGLLRTPRPGLLGLSALALSGTAAGATLAAQWLYLEASNRDLLEWIVTGGYSLAALWAALRLAQAIGLWFDTGALHRAAPASAIAEWFRTNVDTYRPAERGLGFLRIVFLFGAAVVCLLHVFDARYRDFPLPLYAIPIIGFALLGLIGLAQRKTTKRDPRPRTGPEERVLAAWLIPAAAWIAYHEGGGNPYALTWSALCVLFAAAVLAPEFVGRRRHSSHKS